MEPKKRWALDIARGMAFCHAQTGTTRTANDEVGELQIESVGGEDDAFESLIHRDLKTVSLERSKEHRPDL